MGKRMASESSCGARSIGFLIPDGLQESWNYNDGGSNAILLPGRRKSKANDADKALKKSKSKQPPPMSKSKLKKFKQLQEENKNKLLQSKSIRIMEKYKLSDGAYKSVGKCH